MEGELEGGDKKKTQKLIVFALCVYVWEAVKRKGGHTHKHTNA